MSKAGDFEIEVWKGAYPVWCEIKRQGKTLVMIRHGELSDLRYAVQKAEQEARAQLPDRLKHEVLP